MSERRYRIIGAGYAGYGVAKALTDAGILYDQLEATDHLGGIAYVDRFGLRERIEFEPGVVASLAGGELDAGDPIRAERLASDHLLGPVPC